MPIAAPAGTVALAFTDVQGSTQLWERHPEAMRRALDLHDTLARRLLEAHGGYEVKAEGDSFMVAFATPRAAVEWCLALQHELLGLDWPAEILADPAAREERGALKKLLWRGLRVRMGVHLGEPVAKESPTTGRMDYFGPVVNRAARVMAAGHGGQIVVTQAVWDAIREHAEEMGIAAENTGEHRLRDLEATDRLHVLVPLVLVGRQFPPLKTIAAKRTNVVPSPTTFVGREADLAALAALFAGGERLVTLAGPGGTGKTRVSLRYAETVIDQFDGGVWLVELAEARSLEEICAAVGAALSVPLTSGKTSADLVDQLGHALAGRGSILLVLDNFEQLVAHAAETVGRWRTLAPEARFLVSSQETLRLTGEVVRELAPLAMSASEGEVSDAVELFVERARSVRPGWTLAEADAPIVAKIVRELDGIPLAIELAASRIGVLSPAKILERLPRRFDLLGGARRDAPTRQGTLRGAIDWSWSLLKPWEQDALAQCSVFHGGFTLEAVESVLDLGAHEGAPWPMDVIESLRGKSLLRSWEQLEFPGEPRFGMYSNILQYAAEKLVASGKAAAAVERHADYFLREGTAWAEGVDHEGGLEKLRRLSVEFENLTTILRSAADTSPATKQTATRALQAIRAVDPVLSTRGPFAVHLDWLDRALASTEGIDVDPSLKAQVLEMRGRARRVRGRAAEAQADLETALAIAKSIGDRSREGRVLGQLAWVDYDVGSLDTARQRLELALAAVRSERDQFGEAVLLNILGFVCRDADSLEEARTSFENAIAILSRLGSKRLEGAVLGNLAALLRKSGDLVGARPRYERALSLYREFGERLFEGNTLGGLASLFLEEGDLDAARRTFEQSLSILREVGNRSSQAICLGNLGILRLSLRKVREASALFERAAEIAGSVGGRRARGLYLAFHAATLAALGVPDRARELLTTAREELAGEPVLLAAADVLSCELKVSDARVAEEAGELQRAERIRAEIRATLEGVSSGSPEMPALTMRSDDVRAAVKFVTREDRSER